MSLYISRPSTFSSRFYASVESFTHTRYWQLKLSVVLFGFVLLTTYPNYLDILVDPAPRTTFSYFYDKVASPLSPVTFDEKTHGSKIAFRLTVPLLAKLINVGHTVTGKDILLIYLIQSLLLIPFLLMLIRLLNRYMDSVSTVFLVGACSATYLAKAFFWDYECWFDGYAYFFLLAGMCFRRRWLVFATLLLACWTDERAVIALGSVYLFHRLRENDFTLQSLKDLLPQRRYLDASAVVLLVIATYGLIRWWLTTTFGLSTPSGLKAGVSLSFLPFQLKHRLIGIPFTFEGLWIPFALAMWALIDQRLRLLAGLLLGGMLIHTIIAYCVFDITRSLAYAFPLIIIAAILMARDYAHNRKQILMLVMLICVLIPTHYIVMYIIQIPWSLSSFQEFSMALRAL
ncbi:hypothetical protein [Telluribacter sp. SYSU D00476]|uniref:hypothetical protein n=1 Tax=Telluribacter sp. SYSU D00476 TaxID=2811430 RepID=UPI001FF3F1D5|nr:hypothetical protein [Telluribacter sp. SYSU D00476]